MENIRIRLAKKDDAAAMAAIHAFYVRNTAVTFVCEEPTESTFLEKMAHTMPEYPFLTAETADGEVVGFAYASALRPHEAYRWDVELSVYLKHGYPGKGIGTRITTALENLLDAQGYLCLYGCITGSNHASMHMCEKLGYQRVGCFPSSGYKAGEWHDVVWYLKMREQMPEAPAEPVPVDSLSAEMIAKCLQV